MFWATKKKPTREEERAKQINQLKHSFPSVRRPNNDDELFEVRFVADGQFSSLRVFITSEFPDTAPVIQAQGPVQHPWLDSQRVVVGSSKLRHWNSKTTLSEVVEECVQALMAGTNTAITKPPVTVDSYGRPLSTSLPVAQSLPTANTAVNVSNTPAPGPAPVQAQAQLYRNPYAPVSAAPAALPTATATATAAAQPAPHSYPVIANVVPNPSRTSLPYTPSPSPAPAAAPAPLPYGYNYGGATAGASPYNQYSYPALAAVPAATPAVPAAAPAVSSAGVPPAVPPRTPAAAAVAAPAPAYSSPYSAQASPALSSYPAIPAATASPVSAVSAYSAAPAPASAYSAVPASSAYSAVPSTTASSYSAAPAAYSAGPAPVSAYSAVPAVSSAHSTASVYSAVPTATTSSPIAAVPAVSASNKSQPSSSQKQAQQQTMQEDSDEDEGLGAFVMPDIPVHCAELDSMTDVQLQRLINDDVALKALANKQESILSTMSLKDDLRSANLEKATRNVAMAEDIMAMQRKAQDLQAQLRAAHQEYQTEVNAANQEFGINAEEVLKQLDKFKESLDSKSEDIGSKFVHGEMDVNTFLKEYLEVRTKYHDVNDRILLVSKPM